MKKCPKCNAQFEDIQIYCSNCGSLLKEVQNQAIKEPKIERKKKPIVKTIVLSAILILSLIVNIGLGWVSYQIYLDNENFAYKYQKLKKEYKALEDSQIELQEQESSSDYEKLKEEYKVLEDSYLELQEQESGSDYEKLKEEYKALEDSYLELQKNASDYQKLEEEYESLRIDYGTLYSYYMYYEDSARFIGDGGSFYHRSDCARLDLFDSYFYADKYYIIEHNLASPCSYCCGEE